MKQLKSLVKIVLLSSLVLILATCQKEIQRIEDPITETKMISPQLDPGSASDYLLDLVGTIETMRDEGLLGKGNANALISKIENAIKSIEKGNINAAKGHLNAFINQTEAYINSGILTEQGQSFIYIAENEIIMLDGSFIDPTDGYAYPVVLIGTQLWMAENLRTTKYNDGTDIPTVTDGNGSGSTNDEWAALTTGAYCDYNNTPANSTTYGRLYNWYTVDNNAATKFASNGGKNVCPAGWHVPSSAEVMTLVDYLAASGYNYDGTTGYFYDGTWEYNKIAKSLAATTNWSSSTVEGAPGNIDYPAYRNKTGASLLPGGTRWENGLFKYIGYGGYWWSVSVISPGVSEILSLWYNYSFTLGFSTNEKTGGSVRCLKDMIAP